MYFFTLTVETPTKQVKTRGVYVGHPSEFSETHRITVPMTLSKSARLFFLSTINRLHLEYGGLSECYVTYREPNGTRYKLEFDKADEGTTIDVTFRRGDATESARFFYFPQTGNCWITRTTDPQSLLRAFKFYVPNLLKLGAMNNRTGRVANIVIGGKVDPKELLTQGTDWTDAEARVPGAKSHEDLRTAARACKATVIVREQDGSYNQIDPDGSVKPVSVDAYTKMVNYLTASMPAVKRTAEGNGANAQNVDRKHVAKAWRKCEANAKKDEILENADKAARNLYEGLTEIGSKEEYGDDERESMAHIFATVAGAIYESTTGTERSRALRLLAESRKATFHGMESVDLTKVAAAGF